MNGCNHDRPTGPPNRIESNRIDHGIDDRTTSRLAPGTENWMLSYKTTYIIALNKETQEEVGRYLVKGHGLFTVADRACTAETCGTSEGAETPVSGVCPDLT